MFKPTTQIVLIQYFQNSKLLYVSNFISSYYYPQEHLRKNHPFWEEEPDNFIRKLDYVEGDDKYLAGYLLSVDPGLRRILN